MPAGMLTPCPWNLCDMSHGGGWVTVERKVAKGAYMSRRSGWGTGDRKCAEGAGI